MKEGIMDRWEHEVLQTAIRHYGPKHQILKAMEELSELQKELAKFLGGDRNFDRIAEETADVGIMLDQLGLIFENREMVEVWREKKLERLVQRMQEEAQGRRYEQINEPLILDEKETMGSKCNVSLSSIPTYELVKELETREGVETHIAEPYQDVTVSVNGPAIVLAIID